MVELVGWRLVGWLGWLVGPVGLVGSFRIGWLAWTTSRADEPRGWLQKTPAHGHARGSFLKPASRMNLGTSARKCLCGARCAFARLLRGLLQFRAASGDPARVAGIWPPARRPRGKFQRARKRSWSCSQPLNNYHQPGGWPLLPLELVAPRSGHSLGAYPEGGATSSRGWSGHPPSWW